MRWKANSIPQKQPPEKAQVNEKGMTIDPVACKRCEFHSFRGLTGCQFRPKHRKNTHQTRNKTALQHGLAQAAQKDYYSTERNKGNESRRSKADACRRQTNWFGGLRFSDSTLGGGWVRREPKTFEHESPCILRGFISHRDQPRHELHAQIMSFAQIYGNPEEIVGTGV